MIPDFIFMKVQKVNEKYTFVLQELRSYIDHSMKFNSLEQWYSLEIKGKDRPGEGEGWQK